MKKALLLILLMPSVLFSQNNSIIVSGIENSEIAINDHGTSPVLESKNNAFSAELLNFCFECGNIKWSTAKETNCSHFLIMFSRDCKTWNILGQIYGAGNSSAINNYKYPTDLHEVYFKIYQIDFNGSAKEYDPIFGSCKKQKKP
jgi:hypothetical protein